MKIYIAFTFLLFAATAGEQVESRAVAAGRALNLAKRSPQCMRFAIYLS